MDWDKNMRRVTRMLWMQHLQANRHKRRIIAESAQSVRAREKALRMVVERSRKTWQREVTCNWATESDGSAERR